MCAAAGIDWGRPNREWDFRVALLPSGAPAAGSLSFLAVHPSQKNSKRKEDSLHGEGTEWDSIVDYPGPATVSPIHGLREPEFV